MVKKRKNLNKKIKMVISFLSKHKPIVVTTTILLIIFIALLVVVMLRDFTTYSKDQFQISYPKGWEIDPKYYTAIADVNYTEENGKEETAKLPPTYNLLSVFSEDEFQILTVSRYLANQDSLENIRTHLDKNLEIQKLIYPSLQEISRNFFINEEGMPVAQIVYTEDDPLGKLGKLMIMSRIIDGEDGRWDIQYSTQEKNFTKFEKTRSRIFYSFSLKKPTDWAKVGAIASVVSIIIAILVAIIPYIYKKMKNRAKSARE